MSEIRKVAINSYKDDGLSYDELNKLAEQFDNLNNNQLKKELENIESMCCNYNSKSVAFYRIAMSLYDIVCKRHNFDFKY